MDQKIYGIEIQYTKYCDNIKCQYRISASFAILQYIKYQNSTSFNPVLRYWTLEEFVHSAVTDYLAIDNGGD